MKEARKIDLLWVDDEIDRLGSYIKALQATGLSVTTAKSCKEAMDAAKSITFKTIIVDILMPSVDGIETIRRLNKLQPNAVYAVLSSYLYYKEYLEQLRCLDFDVELIDKYLTDYDDEDFVRLFIDPIIRIVSKGLTNPVKNLEIDHPADVSGINPFDIELKDFMRLTMFEKDRLTDLAGELAKDVIDKCFEKGYIWVLLCGKKDIVRAHAIRQEDVFTEEKIKEYAAKIKRVPYQFSKAMPVEDIWTGCGVESHLKDYPTISFKINSQKYRLHFDTGSPITFFSYEELRRINAILDPINFGKTGREGFGDYRYVNFSIFVTMCCQSTGGTREVRVAGQAVREWSGGPFIRTCTETCEHYPNVRSKPRICPERTALIGRNLLTDNKIKVTLDGSTKKTSIGR